MQRRRRINEVKVNHFTYVGKKENLPAERG